MLLKTRASRPDREQIDVDADGLHVGVSAADPLSVIGTSPAIGEVRLEATLAAQCDAPLLVVGERGVGKAFIARLIHQHSGRRGAPFVAVECRSRPEVQLELELFGDSKDSAGAAPAALERADGGTVFLDAIGELTGRLQGRLMRFLDSREVRAGAYARPRHVDVRIIGSTRVPLMGGPDATTFREDLYYRLNAIYLQIPAVRERRSDIDPLLEHFMTHHSQRRGVIPPALKRDRRAAIQAYDWPDNVRELEATAERMVAEACDEQLGPRCVMGDQIGYAMSPARRRATLAFSSAKRVEQLVKDAERRKDDLVVTLAHEVRNPLAAILAALDVMRFPVAPAAADRAHQVIKRQVRQIDRLVEGLMEATRWARGKVTLHKTCIDFRGVIAEAANDVMRSVEQHGHELIVANASEPVWVDADRSRLQQLFSNLLENAVKYTDRGGRIWLTVERDESKVTVRVRDTGRGMKPGALHHIFDLFTQVGTLGSEGLGIGLSVVREIVKLHDGTIAVRSPGLGQGSEFIVTLPVCSDASQA